MEYVGAKAVNSLHSSPHSKTLAHGTQVQGRNASNKNCVVKSSLIVVAVAVGIESNDRGFGQEKLDRYPAVIQFISWAFRVCQGMKSCDPERT